ncbi:hypothetical protein [Zavarzinella formosa]|uniref:hypothetical protein n=1 Tax=Zavarzinella formosa TaxID=360055 RepID=UPI000313A130|nr:hypothetical protein [Zavarzinella formosa]
MMWPDIGTPSGGEEIDGVDEISTVTVGEDPASRVASAPEFAAHQTLEQLLSGCLRGLTPLGSPNL